MTTKRTHGQCTCGENDPPGHKETCPVYRRGPCTCGGQEANESCAPWCPSLYPAQQEPDALTKLVHFVRFDMAGTQEDQQKALTLISEAREEQRKAGVRSKNEGLEEAAAIFITEENEADRVASAAGSEKRRIEWLERAGELGAYVRRIRAKKVEP